MEEDLKKIGKAGIGAAATLTEKAKESVNKYSKKGEEILNKGVLSRELRNKADDALDNIKEKTDNVITTMKNKSDNMVNTVKDMMNDHIR